MREAPTARLLPGGRLLLQHGPIDLLVRAEGERAEVEAAYAAARHRFEGLLDELCAELPLLRARAGTHPPLEGKSRRRSRWGGDAATGPVARRMQSAVAPFADRTFITPMAAVAGAVAEEILGTMCAAAPLRRAFVNNGGDIALHLAEGEAFRIGLVDRPDRSGLFGTTSIASTDLVRGVATSGYPGRSFSRGIAEAVTVLAATAAAADAAATVIANAVDLPGHPAVARVPASSVQTDSDLGDILVTRRVGPLGPGEIGEAIEAGLREALRLRDEGLVAAVAIHLQGISRVLEEEQAGHVRRSLPHA
jgi:ApbE superfamily uncharacterized protein (UPF0280 family)